MKSKIELSAQCAGCHQDVIVENDANGRNVFVIKPCKTCIESGVYKKFAEVLEKIDLMGAAKSGDGDT